MILSIKTTGDDFKKTRSFLDRMLKGDLYSELSKYGQMGVDALSNATPRESGETANSWNFRINHKKGFHEIEWFNTNVNNEANIAILIQYGHGTGTGGYVPGIDYINPALRPIFDQIANSVWEKVKA